MLNQRGMGSGGRLSGRQCRWAFGDWFEIENNPEGSEGPALFQSKCYSSLSPYPACPACIWSQILQTLLASQNPRDCILQFEHKWLWVRCDISPALFSVLLLEPSFWSLHILCAGFIEEQIIVSGEGGKGYILPPPDIGTCSFPSIFSPFPSVLDRSVSEC